ncbi:peptidoglycan-binding protein [Chelatococcus sambhunathii]|uniref:Peptidoglycan-binding protein n=1 Tax=Chelatococcus sambhunathii TaxID=363953 RepID=A0ABU1DH93_9HYPH|nr:peptidoglycan-binding domain-containing protein [Chelatococcus sambhunathii]MDR4307487.1 peptidoglycan-binding protein [Chelatococcus sambhunathii]
MPRVSVTRHQLDDEPSGLLGAALALAARRPLDSLAAFLAATCTVMIFVNALVIQQGRPSPDKPRTAAQAAQPVQQAQPAQRPETPKRSDLVEQVQTALAERGLYDGVVDGLPGGGTTAAIKAFERSQGLAQTGEASERILAALLTAPMKRSDAAPPSPRPAKAIAPAPAPAPASTGSTAAANPTLMAAQRALAKIGYGPVSIDGKLGTETRNAIRAFERDRGLPETGELSPSVLRALQAMTGTPLQ